MARKRQDAARREADEKAAQAAGAVAPEAEVVATGVGDSDPAKAIEDALRQWPADEVLVVTPPDEDANWLEDDAAEEAQKRLGVPLRHVTLGRGMLARRLQGYS